MANIKTMRQKAKKANAPAEGEQILTAILRRAEARGYILPGEIREELSRLGYATRRWREFIRRAGSLLAYQNGRYYYVPSLNSERLREEERYLHVRALLQALMDAYKRTHHRIERRSTDRIEVVWPVTVTLEDGTQHRAVTRDISISGIRLLGSRSLLGQKVSVLLALSQQQEHVFSVRILWTCEVGDNLYENGGTVLEVSVPGARSIFDKDT